MNDRLQDLEHDSAEDLELSAVPVTAEKEEPQVNRRAAEREALRQKFQREERPWLHPDNPALWEGEDDDEEEAFDVFSLE